MSSKKIIGMIIFMIINMTLDTVAVMAHEFFYIIKQFEN